MNAGQARETAPRKRKGEKQERSLQRRALIAEAAIKVLATKGVAGLTHRIVAQEADVPLASTTYYFENKFEIISEASRRTLDAYSEAFRDAAERFKKEPNDPELFKSFAARLVRNAVERDRIRALCWAEITLDARRNAESLLLARQWFVGLSDVWQEMAENSGLPNPREAARSAIDLLIGLLLVTTSLGLTAEQVDAVLKHGADPLSAWKIDSDDTSQSPAPKRKSKKAHETREKIVSAAIEILIKDGPDAVTYRAVAHEAGITQAGPFYHFPSVDLLMGAAQQRLFEESKQRYREVASEIGQINDVEKLIDRTTAVLLRESTEFAGHNLASYTIWLQAARNPKLRPMIWGAVSDQCRAWQRLLGPLSSHSDPLSPLFAFCSFVGAHVRLISTGSPLQDLASVRSEFASDLTALTKSEHWFIHKLAQMTKKD